MKLIICLILFFSVGTYADDFPQDSIFDLNSLEYNDSISVPDYNVEYSSGWFPRLTQKYSYISFELSSFFGNTWDIANNIKSTAFVDTRNPFSHDFKLNESDREIKKENSSENESDYPQTNYFRYIFGYGFNPTNFVIVNFKTGFNLSYGLIASTDESKSYLDYFGNKVNFKEANIIEISEYSISNIIELNIPFYGAMISQISKTKNISEGLGSFYYLIAGINADYTYCSSANQYSQIANIKDELRYINGIDTIHLQTDKVLNGLNRMRYFLSTGIGMDFNFFKAGLAMEIKWKYPLTSILKDTDWKQHFIYLNFMFYGIL